MDQIGKIYPTSFKRHNFIIMAVYYFTKWVEAQSMINMGHDVIIRFILHEIVYRFHILKIIRTD